MSERHGVCWGTATGVMGRGVNAAVRCSNGSGMCESCGRRGTAVGWNASVGSSTGADAMPVEMLGASTFTDDSTGLWHAAWLCAGPTAGVDM